MPVCQACQAEYQSRPASGRCEGCGAPLPVEAAALAGDPKQTIALGGDASAGRSGGDSIDLELHTGGDDTANDQTVELSSGDTAAVNELPPDGRTIEVEGVSDTTLEQVLPGSDERATVDSIDVGRVTQGGGKDMTLDLSAPDVDLDIRMTGEWSDAAAAAHDHRHTLRKSDTFDAGDAPISSRKTLPIRSRSLRERPDNAQDHAPSPSDAPDYELLSRIGEGGMGVVYAAHQSSIARTVAVKMLKPDAKESDDQRRKFLSEAVVTGELDHPNIVPIYDLGAGDSGALFYSMKRVNGTPWDEVLTKKTLEENLGILMRVADAVAFAHAGGVVHRDLKPENVMLGDYGEVLVMDWGLARVTSAFRNPDRVHQSDNLGGTPAYMAPEMARGPVEKIDARSDVYLLGALLYEVVTGEPPHTGEDVMKCLMAAARNKITPANPERVEGRGELVDIALRAMSTDQSERYQSVKEFQEAVQTYQSHSESLLLSAGAERRLDEARVTGDYEVFANALFGFKEALSLWPENPSAKKLLGQAQTIYATAALHKGDYDLAASLLRDARGRYADPEQAKLLEKVQVAQTERDARQRRITNLKRLAMALVALVIGVTTISYFAVRQQYQVAVTERQRAEEQREEAERQEAIAIEQRKEAIQQKQVADTERERAEEQEQLALKASMEAVKQRDIAKEQRDIADQQRAIAEELKQNEEREAYVAMIGLAAEKIDENAFEVARRLLDECKPEELRAWEWGRLAHLCRLSPQVYDLSGPVYAVAFSPDGGRLATGDDGGVLTVRDRAAGDVVFQKQGSHVLALAYSPDGRWIATGSSDGKTRIVDAATGDELKSLAGHEGGVLSVAFSPDGRRLLTGGEDTSVRLWDLTSGKQTAIGDDHTWWVWSARFSPDGSRAVTAGQDGRVLVWNVGVGLAVAAEFTEHEGPVYAAAFAPDGSRVASAGRDGAIRVWSPARVRPVSVADRLDDEPSDPTPHTILKGHAGPVRTLAYSASGEWLVSGGNDNTLRLWESSTGEPVQVFRGHGRRVMSSAMSPDGTVAASGSEDSSVRLWSLEGYSEQRVLRGVTLTGHADAVLNARFSADGTRVVTASRDRTAGLWDVSSGQRLRTFSEGHEFLASTAAFFADGKRMATGAGDGTVRLWNLAAGTEYATLRPTGQAAALAVAPAGDWVVTGGPGAEAIVWDAATGERLATLPGHEAKVTAAAFSPSGKWFATGDDQGNLLLWSKDNATNSGEPRRLNGHSRSITALAFASDERLVSASGDKTCGQWDLTTGSEIRDRVLKHPDWVSGLDVSADGRWAITCCDDGFARVWRLADASVAAQTESEGAVFTSVDLSADAKQALLTSGSDRVVKKWDLAAAFAGGSTPATVFDGDTLEGDLFAARWAGGGRMLTIGGNDAVLWNEQGQQSMRFSPHGAVAAAAVSADGKLVATGSWDQSVKLWDAATGDAIAKISSAHAAPIQSVAFAPDDKTLLTSGDDGVARLWRIGQYDQPLAELRGHTGHVPMACYSPNGERVLTVSSDRTARVWNATTGQPERTLSGHRRELLCGAFSPTGDRVVTGDKDALAIVWDLAGEREPIKLIGHTAAVAAVAFSPDGRRVITGGHDGAARVWDASTGKEILSLEGHEGELTAVGFSPDGQTALTAGRDGAVVLWPAAPWR